MAIWRPPGWEPIPEEGETREERRERRTAESRALRAGRSAAWSGRIPPVEEGYQAELARQRFDKTIERAYPMSDQRMPNPKFLPDAQLIELVERLARNDRYDWNANARPEQIEPESYRTWLLKAGRGYGKTRVGSETVRKWCKKPNQRIAVVAKASRELRDYCFEGVSGLNNVFEPHEIKTYRKGLGDTRLELTNGCMIHGYTAGEPDAVRGASFHGAWCDEFAAWPHWTAQDMLDQLWFCLRESPNPRVIITTTPKRVKHVMDLMNRARKGDKSIVVTHGKTIDNAANLGAAALAELEARYGGTRLGAQELSGELLEDVEGALWTDAMLETARWDADDLPPLKKIITGFDPSGSATGDATGIVTIGYDDKNRIFVLECMSTQGHPAARYTAACLSAYRCGADLIMCEYNFGGDNARFGLEKQWDHLVETGVINMLRPPIEPSTLKGDKAVKASPVAALYEQQMNVGVERIFHAKGTSRNGMDTLESELTSWEPGDKVSPNSLDALVIAVRRAMRELGWEPSINQASARHRIDPGGYRPF